MVADLVLVTGASGFIGFKVLVLLLESGYKVRTAVRNTASFERIKSLKSVAPYLSQLEPIVIPDIMAPNSYDEAVRGVKYIIHMASPFANPELFSADFEVSYIQPAIRGTIGILDSANKNKGIERIVITASVQSIASFSILGTDTVVNETHRSATSEKPYPNWLLAYAASKVQAYDATKQWMAEQEPSFDLINILPTFVLGRDDSATDPSVILKGANGVLMGPVLGNSGEMPSPGVSVHVDDVAMMHVRSLNRSIPGNEDYLASSHSFQGIEWEKAFDIIEQHYPEECKDGVFKIYTTKRPQTVKLVVDATKAERTFGFTFKPFKEQVLSVASQYLELAKQ